MRKLLVAAAAALAFGAIAPNRAQAAPLAADTLRPAIDSIGAVAQVRYCEFFDPALGDWVSFYVPGPCLRAGMPGFDIWLGRYYRGHRHWRGRVGARPWEGGHRGPHMGGRPRVEPRHGGNNRMGAGGGRPNVQMNGGGRPTGNRSGGGRSGGGHSGGGRSGGDHRH
jgi:hypothetical protein